MYSDSYYVFVKGYITPLIDGTYDISYGSSDYKTHVKESIEHVR